MPLIRDRCICLGKFEYSETSQIVSLFSRNHGLFRALAKGAHRRTKAGAGKFDGGIDLLDLGDAVSILDPARDLATLTEWTLTDGHLPLRNNLRAGYLALYAAELVSSLLEEHDSHPELFDRLQATVAELPTARIEEIFLSFALDVLQQTGHAPQLINCANCGVVLEERTGAHYSPQTGGMVCRSCQGPGQDRFSIDPRLLRVAQQLMQLPRGNGLPQRLPRLTRHQTDPLNKLIALHVQHTTGRALKMPPYLLRSR